MKNAYNFLIVLAIMVFVIGCSCGNLSNLVSTDTPPKETPSKETPSKETATTTEKPKTSDTNANKTMTDKVTDVATTGEKIGIQECDELMDSLRVKIESDSTDFVTKAVLKALEAQFREGIKQSLEQNNADRDATASLCKELKKSMDDKVANQAK
jgi:hypothetical protein